MTSTEAFKELPRDIAAVDVKGMTYVFFVNSNHQLCYLKSPGPETDDYEPKLVKSKDRDLKVKCGSRQIAAVSWQGENGTEIRVYVIATEKGQCENKGYIQEVAFSSSTDWEHGIFGFEEDGRQYVDKDASLTACIHTWPDKTDIKVFASGKGETGRPKITMHQYSYGHKKWLPKVISNKVSDW
ncbi:hypothetical protein H9Q69_012346 [Fusarium xylarioides]|uniref:Fucose-specific lectin n=1 Tax=Fusarium xylarioides TaxID=221167 RepID=A0A9P7HGA1_9HYPO|nr:hypothetical protein H9Q72_011630 [Fusarium xylarioides]KAG5788593.1 hypothetical protein H9Q69_012346 [Fusarium xylarioides]KAG5802579.1 hypothetical protein H9Q71_012842 [Fusarium xylarioides]KAG5814898.1 hypothetical protein H9Q74_011998 [Fusarium xylarioides]